MAKEPFKSSLELATLAEYAGNPENVRTSLESQLRELGIDCSVAIQDLPGGADDHREAIVRLVSLARANGHYVVLESPDKKQGIRITISAPARNSHQLQSGHH